MHQYIFKCLCSVKYTTLTPKECADIFVSGFAMEVLGKSFYQLQETNDHTSARDIPPHIVHCY